MKWFLSNSFTTVFLIVLLVISSLLSACCGSNSSEPVTLIAGFTDTPTTLNPFWAQRYPTTAFMGPIMEPLVYAMEDGSIEPCLAESWEQSDDGLEYAVYIDPRAQWSDGQPVTADDVIFTYQLHWRNDAEWSQARMNNSILKKGIDSKPATDALVKVDDKTVVFTLADTYATQIFLTSLSTIFICPKHIWEPKVEELGEETPYWSDISQMGIADYALEDQDQATIESLLIGSGPFLYEQYMPEQSMVYKTNLNYWTGTPAKIDKVVFKIYADPQVATLALRSSEVDCLPLIEKPQEVATLLQNPNVKIDVMTNYSSTIMFMLNMRFPPLNVLDVRKAIDMAIERRDLIDYTAFGYGTMPQQIPFAPGLYESNSDVAWAKAYVDAQGNFKSKTQRITDANALLDSVPGMSTIAGGVNGIRTYLDANGVAQKVSFEGLYRPNTSQPSIVYDLLTEMIAADLLEIGIEIIPTVETGAFGPKVFGGRQVWDYETIVFGYPGIPSFDDRIVDEWANHVCFASCDAGIVGWRNNPSEAPPGTENGPSQTYDTPYENPTVEEQEQWMAIYDQMVEESDPLTDAIYATRTITDPDERLAAVKQVQQLFAEKLPIITLYHPQYLSAYSKEYFTGWGDPVGVHYYGFSPPTVSVKTLMSVEPNNPRTIRTVS